MKLNCRVKSASQVDCYLWNMSHKVGSQVTVINADGSMVDGRTGSLAWMLGGTTPAVSVHVSPHLHGVFDLKNVKEKHA